MSFRNVFYTSAILIIGAISCTMHAQLNSVSTNLLGSFNAYTLPANVMEFEPTYTYTRSLGYFNSAGDYQDSSGAEISSSLYFRSTYGVTDIFELSAGLTTDLDVLNLGAKLYLIGNDHIGFALMGGINSNITSGSRPLSSLTRQYIIGVGGHYLFSDALSVNASLQFQDLRAYEGSDNFFNAEVGYYVSDHFLVIAGVGISNYSNSELPPSSLFSLIPGFAIERNKLAITFQGQLDLMGENIESSTRLGVSITLILD